MLAAFFVAGGVNHFARPAVYLSIMPRYLRWPEQLVAVSGAAEILGGVGILFSRTRKLAGWGLVALLIAVFPANIQSIATGVTIAGRAIPKWVLWARLPLQGVLVAWVYVACVRQEALPPDGHPERSRGTPS